MIDEVIEALEPLANLAKHISPARRDFEHMALLPSPGLNVGDIRRAAALLPRLRAMAETTGFTGFEQKAAQNGDAVERVARALAVASHTDLSIAIEEAGGVVDAVKAFEGRDDFADPRWREWRIPACRGVLEYALAAIAALPDPEIEGLALTETICREKVSEGWQPIETAPKDGTDILAWCVHPNAKYTDALVGFTDWQAPVVTRWIEHNGGEWTRDGLFGEYTHWRPLPAPPRASPSAAMEGGRER